MDSLNLNSVSFRESESFLRSFTDGPKRDKGQVFLLIDLPDNPGAEDSISEKVWRALRNSYFNCQADDSYFCFEEALKRANEVVEQEGKKRESGSIGRLHAVAALKDGRTLHFSQIGLGTLYLQRGQHFSQISEESETEGDGSFSTISSGELADSDRVVMSSRPLPFETDELVEVFSQKGAKLANQIKSLGRSSDLTGIVSHFLISSVEESGVLSDESEPVREEAVQSKELQSGPEQRRPKMIRLADHKVVQALSKHFNKEKLKGVSKVFEAVVSGLVGKLGKMIKRPELVKQVNRRYILVGVISLVVIFGVVLVLQSGYREKQEQTQYYEDLLSQVSNNITTAENRFLIGEKSDATEFLNQASRLLYDIETAGFFQTDVDRLKKEVQVFRDSFDKIIREQNPALVVDLSTKGTVDGLGFVHTQDAKNIVYEPRKLYETVAHTIQDPITLDSEEIIVTGWELEDFKVISFMTQNGQMIEYQMNDGRFVNMSTQDEVWQKGVDLKTFHGEYVYLLDPSSNTIWKYQRLRTSYGKASAYTSKGDLSTAISMTIDGDVYVLLRDGTILKYRKGELLAFEIQDQPSIPLKNPTRIFTFPEADNFYVLDSGNSRVVVYSKGSDDVSRYQKQVIFDGFEPDTLRDLYVDTSEQKVMVMTDNKIYITDL